MSCSLDSLEFSFSEVFNHSPLDESERGSTILSHPSPVKTKAPPKNSSSKKVLCAASPVLKSPEKSRILPAISSDLRLRVVNSDSERKRSVSLDVQRVTEAVLVRPRANSERIEAGWNEDTGEYYPFPIDL